MSKAWKITILAVLAAILIVAGASATYAVAKRLEDTKQAQVHIYTPTELLAEANKLRAEKGVAPLKLDERLNASAAWKAQDMAVYGYFGHVRDGYHGYQMVNQVAPECTASENIELNTGTYASPFDWWVTSKPHYTAIVDAKYDTTGFGAYQKDGKVYYVEHFCDLR